MYSKGEILLERQLEFCELGGKKGALQMHKSKSDFKVEVNAAWWNVHGL